MWARREPSRFLEALVLHPPDPAPLPTTSSGDSSKHSLGLHRKLEEREKKVEKGGGSAEPALSRTVFPMGMPFIRQDCKAAGVGD